MSQTWKIVLAVIITTFVVSGVFYLWQQNKEIDTPQITQETETLTPAPTPVVETEKTFVGNGFSFTYPKEYTADSKGLWTEEGYKNHLNPPFPPETCDVCQIPAVEIKTATSDQTLDQQILADYYLPDETLAGMSERTNIKYEPVKIGDNYFIKITVSDLFDITGYYTKHNSQIVGFRVYWNEKDNEALRKIISTLKFE